MGHIRLIDADAVRRVVRCRLHNECGIATSVAPLEGGTSATRGRLNAWTSVAYLPKAHPR
ncbi:MAG UNVERIFIED_CONTAM: hypothetical protein LVT10_18320 [Anaerolineae bacterium]